MTQYCLAMVLQIVVYVTKQVRLLVEVPVLLSVGDPVELPLVGQAKHHPPSLIPHQRPRLMRCPSPETLFNSLAKSVLKNYLKLVLRHSLWNFKEVWIPPCSTELQTLPWHQLVAIYKIFKNILQTLGSSRSSGPESSGSSMSSVNFYFKSILWC